MISALAVMVFLPLDKPDKRERELRLKEQLIKRLE